MKIPNFETLRQETQKLYNVLNEAPDFVCVLTSTNYLDQTLAGLLKGYLIKSNTADNLLNPLGGALGSFSSRTDLCYTLGLISKDLYKNLRTMGEIRNKFAHSYFERQLDDNEIKDSVESLIFPAMIVKKVGDSPNLLEQVMNPRDKFNIIATFMVNRLLLTGLSITKREQNTKGW